MQAALLGAGTADGIEADILSAPELALISLNNCYKCYIDKSLPPNQLLNLNSNSNECVARA